ncbi:S8 family peptidase [Sphingomonas sp. 1P06PA]|uniref:S8 family peptidase n=1 Tax=Sphingomonas sp. 1P06PA TaxID=554121 RepID=UPI0039A4A922
MQLRGIALGSLAFLAGCGGGGGGGGVQPTPAPPVVPTPTNPTPPITPPPTGSANDTAEFRRSDGALLSGAIYGWDAGATGRGVTAAIIDGGLTDVTGEFTGRISPASTDTTGNNRAIADSGGHGTAVAGVLAAARNDSGIVGVAYDAQLLVLKSDTPGSCVGFNSCSHSDQAIARAVDVAVAQRARVINLSLGGSAAQPVLINAIDRATAAGIVVVISAGNDGMANPDPFALLANNAAARGLVLIAGAFDPNGEIASFSNRAGSGASHYLLGPGQRLRSVDNVGDAVLVTGTSFATPVIAGAVALLAQAFPTLTGAEIVQLLFDTANDLGPSGTDATYGRGRIDLSRAFRPRGSTALAGSGIVVTGDAANGVTSAAMGDAGRGGTAQAVVLDTLGRAYGVDLAATIARSGPEPRLTAALSGGQQRVSAGFGPGVIALTIDGNGARALTLDQPQVARARASAGMMAARIGPRTAFALGFSTSGTGLAAQISGRGSTPFLIARDPAGGPGFLATGTSALALRHDLGPLGVTVTADRGFALAPRLDPGRRDRSRHGYTGMGLAIDRPFGPLRLGVGWSRLSERRTVLGALFRPGLAGGGTTDFADISADLALGRWSLAAQARHGWTRAEGVIGGARLASSAFAVDLARAGILTPGDRLSLRVAQPLRVSSGGLELMLPTGFDYAGGVTATTATRIGLAPHGREIDVEAGWGAPLLGGWFSTSLFWRSDPGHFEALPDDRGAAIRFSAGF